MPPLAPETEIRSTVEAIAAEHGLFVEDVHLRRRGGAVTVEITLDLADGPGALDSDRLGEVSREISAAMDEIDVVPGAYTLEIGTPGAVRELTTPRLYRRAEGRLVAFDLAVPAPGTRVLARVVAADEEAVTVRRDDDAEPTRVSYGDIERAVIELELR